MKNLTTRRILLGLLMTFVLALGVQGITDAATISFDGSTTADLSWRGINATNEITIVIIATLTQDSTNESVTLRVGGGGATFPSPADSTKNVTSYVWRETGDINNADGTPDRIQGSFPDPAGAPGTVTVTVKNAGEVTVTLSATGATTLYRTYYVVKHSFSVSPTDKVSLTNVTNGVGARYSGNVKVHSGDGRNNPVNYTVTGGGSLYVQKGTDTTRRLDLTGSPIKTSSNADVWLNMGTNNSNTVTVKVENSNIVTQGVYIHGNPRLAVTPTTKRIEGAPGSAIATNAIQVAVNDQNSDGTSGGAVLDVPVKFDVVDKQTGGYLIPSSIDTDSDGFSDNIVDVNNNPIRHTDVPSAPRTVYVRTPSAGGASVGFQFGTVPGKSDIMVSVSGRNVSLTEKVEARVTGGGTTTLSIESNRRRSGNSKIFDLVAHVEQNGANLRGATVLFRASFGELSSTPTSLSFADSMDADLDNDATETIKDFGTGTDASTTAPQTGSVVNEITDHSGLAQVTYNLGDNTGRQEIVAIIYDSMPDSRRVVTFVVNGPADTSGNQGSGGSANTISVSPSSITGEAGTTQSLTISAGTATVRVADASAFETAGGTISGTGATRSITLPDTPGSNYTITFSASGYTDVTVPVIVTAPIANGTLTPTLGTRTGDKQPITVRAVRGGSARSGVNITITGGVTSTSRQTDASGSASAIITLPTATSAHTLTASAPGYDPAEVRVPAPGPTTRDPSEPTTTRGSVGVADSIQVSGQVFRTGRLNTQLDLPLSVRILDGNNTGVSGVKVTFRVKTGQGRLSQRGNGRGIVVETDGSGYARAPYTPLAKGTSTVRVNAAGVTQTVTFTITVDGATGDTGTDTRDPTSGDPTSPQEYNVGDKIPISLEDTLKFTGSRTVSGTTYTCVGSGECVVSYGTLVKGEIRATAVPKVEAKTYKVGDKISISLEDTLEFTGSRTVSGTTYTCVGSGECVVSYGTLVKGEIRSAAQKSDTTPPGTGSTPGREINPEVLLAAAQRPPMLWVDSGTIYALVGADVQPFATGIENVQNIAVSGNKIYWTQMTGENAGTINSANLDGSGATELVSIKAVPRGIAVDSVAKRLYWANSQGWIQSSNLQGGARRNIISGGLENPMGIAVANGTVYWTQDRKDAPIERAIPTEVDGPAFWDSKSVLGTPTSLAIADGKIYWTQMTGENAGTINSVNLNGSGATELVSIRAVPSGITVDPGAKRLYWTNSQGWIQSSNLQGTARKNVAKGLGSPSSIALSANIKAPATTAVKSTTTAGKNKYDVNGDGSVDNVDAGLVTASLGMPVTKENEALDVDGDGSITFTDVRLVLNNPDEDAAGAPMLFGMKLTAEQIARIEEQIDLFIATGDRSPEAMRTLIYLQQLIATARPEKTQLLANYPNPFNPETWMPYELAVDTDVRITIYAANGVVVRTLHLGQQSAGYYTDRERAAYWDGRNALGEQVASGIYFYQLETDSMSALRKMVILK